MPTDYVTKERSLITQHLPFKTRLNTGAWSVTDNKAIKWEKLTSRRNDWPNTRRSDSGGDFTKLTYTEVHNSSYIHSVVPWSDVVTYEAIGHYLASQPKTVASVIPFFGALTMGAGEMQVAGTRFVSEASPTAPKAGLATALVELKREGLPRLDPEALSNFIAKWGKPKQKLSIKDVSSKGAGSDYLNWQFGWVPLVSDIRAMAKSILEMDELLAQLYRDDGRVVRHKRGNKDHWRISSETKTDVVGYGAPVMNSYHYGSSTPRTWTSDQTSRALWFSGAFMYHLPGQVGVINQLRQAAIDARYLFGLSVSPIDVWNLVPWTWLADWFVNTGDVLSNVSDQIYNQQVMKYGYVMAHTKRELFTQQTSVLVNHGLALPSSKRTYDVKQRMQATPFGFGLSWTGFSTSQLAILSALGLSRGR